jgi:hypothetical protein
VIYAPGVFEREQYVLPENWDFSHEEDDRSHSISYTITFVRIGEGRKVSDPHGIPPPPQPGKKKIPKAKPIHIFHVRDGARTFKAIARGLPRLEQVGRLVDLNRGQLAAFWRGEALNKRNHIPTHQLPYYRWPIRTKIRY